MDLISAAVAAPAVAMQRVCVMAERDSGCCGDPSPGMPRTLRYCTSLQPICGHVVQLPNSQAFGPLSPCARLSALLHIAADRSGQFFLYETATWTVRQWVSSPGAAVSGTTVLVFDTWQAAF